MSICACVTACGPTVTHTVNFNPSEPLRLAVLPFRYVGDGASSSEVAPPTSNLLIDSINPLASVPTSSPTQLARTYVQNELTATRFDVLTPFLVEATLAHSGLTNSEGAFLQQKIHALSPQEICEEFLTCDAVLYGTVYDWDRDYYGIESVSSVDIEVVVRSARTGAEIFRSRGKDSDRRGISGGPTGFSDLVLEPIRGLDASIIEELAQKTIASMFRPLRNKPTSPIAGPPSIYAAATDSHHGNFGSAKPLLVLMYGSSTKTASFSIGSVIRDIPMVEKYPGHYAGEYYPLDGDSFSQQAVTVQLRDEFGRAATHAVPGQALQLSSPSSQGGP
jgi:hypothetical protein